MIGKIGRLLFTIWAYLTFLITLMVAFGYHIIVLLITRGKGVDLMYKCYKPWTYAWGLLNGIKYEISGRENLEKGKSYIFVCNHGSTGDIFIVAALSDLNYRPLGKIELTHIPIMGFMFRRALVLVDRSSEASRKRSMKEMKKVLAQNYSILILPEGTRNRTSQPLKDFYDGAFRLAIDCQIPIVPIVHLNSRVLFPNDSPLMNHVDLKCRINPPISTEGMTKADVPSLKERVYNLMEQQILQEDLLFRN